MVMNHYMVANIANLAGSIASLADIARSLASLADIARSLASVAGKQINVHIIYNYL